MGETQLSSELREPIYGQVCEPTQVRLFFSFRYSDASVEEIIDYRVGIIMVKV